MHSALVVTLSQRTHDRIWAGFVQVAIRFEEDGRRGPRVIDFGQGVRG